MATLDKIAYIVKTKMPAAYNLAAAAARGGTVLLYGKAISEGNAKARLEGTVLDTPAVMRTLTADDLEAFAEMIASIPEKHLTYFHPHGLDRASLASVIRRRDIMTYGLFRDGRMEAYALLKLFPTRKAYIGRLVSPALTGLGMGKFLSRFLYWQAALMGFQPCSTIHEDNVASLKSHASVRPFEIVSELPNGYRLIRFEVIEEDHQPPELHIVRRDRPSKD